MNITIMDNETKNNTSPEEELEIVDEEGSDAAKQKMDKYKKALEECRKEKAEYLDGWQRAKAEFINYKKDEAKRFEEMARYAAEDIVQDILPILDNFQLALSYELPQNTEKGILMIKTQMEDLLKKRGIVPIEVRPGDMFDSGLHESIGEKESGSPEGTVAEEVQRGYLMHGRVIRPSRVRLSKRKD